MKHLKTKLRKTKMSKSVESVWTTRKNNVLIESNVMNRKSSKCKVCVYVSALMDLI